MRAETRVQVVQKDSRDIKNCFEDAARSKCNMVLFFLNGDREAIYYDIKSYGERQFGIGTQCLDGRKIADGKKTGGAYQDNVLFKINLKLAGTNTRFVEPIFPPVQNRQAPTLFLGGDVYRGKFEANKVTTDVNVSALVGMQFVEHGTNYYHAWTIGQTEELLNMEEHMVKIFQKFEKLNGCLPERIIYFRNSLPEGRRDELARAETNAIRGAAQAVNKNAHPRITFLALERKTHVRLFPAKGDQDNKGNAKPGLFIDSGIVENSGSEFFAVTHSTLQGTASVAHYSVLIEENGMTMDDIWNCTWKLCHAYGVCPRSVSVPAPVYYAKVCAEHCSKYAQAHHSVNDPGVWVPPCYDKVVYA